MSEHFEKPVRSRVSSAFHTTQPLVPDHSRWRWMTLLVSTSMSDDGSSCSIWLRNGIVAGCGCMFGGCWRMVLDDGVKIGQRRDGKWWLSMCAQACVGNGRYVLA